MENLDMNGDLIDHLEIDLLRSDDVEITSECPRCHAMHDGRFYGPCASCRDELRATMGLEARDIEVPEYEPKLNVTPNAVALKDD